MVQVLLAVLCSAKSSMLAKSVNLETLFSRNGRHKRRRTGGRGYGGWALFREGDGLLFFFMDREAGSSNQRDLGSRRSVGWGAVHCSCGHGPAGRGRDGPTVTAAALGTGAAPRVGRRLSGGVECPLAWRGEPELVVTFQGVVEAGGRRGNK